MHFVDTHAHLDFPDFDNDREGLISRLQEEGISAIINVGSTLRGCLAAIDLASQYEFIYAAVGIHPHHAKEIDTNGFERVKSLLKAKKVVAIGEVGLDFYRNLSPADIQKELFRQFIDLSILSNLPLIIHSRQAEKETLEILEGNSSGKPKGVLHCFSGSEDFLKSCLGLGLYISFTCNITYKKSGHLRDVVKLVPLERLLLETDCPYLSPEGLRGKRNEPKNVKILAQFVADLRGCSIEDIAKSTTGNAQELFGI